MPSGNLSLLALSTLFLTWFFSSSVKWLGSLTVTLPPGTVGVMLPASVVLPFWPWTNWSPGMVSFEPSGYVTLVVPSSPTVTLVPSGNLSLLASSTFFLTLSFSGWVKWLGSATGSLVVGTFGLIFSASVSGRTKSLPSIVSVDLVWSVWSG